MFEIAILPICITWLEKPNNPFAGDWETRIDVPRVFCLFGWFLVNDRVPVSEEEV